MKLDLTVQPVAAYVDIGSYHFLFGDLANKMGFTATGMQWVILSCIEV